MGIWSPTAYDQLLLEKVKTLLYVKLALPHCEVIAEAVHL